jgi:hypothetical protein
VGTVAAKAVIAFSTKKKFVLGTFPTGARINCGVIGFNAKGFGPAMATLTVTAS